MYGYSPLKKDPRGWRRVIRDTRGKHCHQDCSFLKDGSIIHLQCNVDGVGICGDDLHAYISEGELAFAGIEVNGSVQLRIERCSEWYVDWPIIETKEEIFVICSYAVMNVRQPKMTYTDYVKAAYKSMREIISKKVNCSIQDANSIVATASGIRNCALYGMEGYITGFKDYSQLPQGIVIAGYLPKMVFNVE